MTGRRGAAVVVGLALSVLGAYLGLTPVDAPLPPDGPPSAVPFLDVITAYERRPGRVVLAVGVLTFGVAVAVAGLVAGQRRR